MKDFIVINNEGKLIDNSNPTYYFSGHSSVGWAGMTASYAIPSVAQNGSIMPLVAQSTITNTPLLGSSSLIGPIGPSVSTGYMGQISGGLTQSPSNMTIVNANGVSFGMNGVTQLPLSTSVRYISGDPRNYGYADSNLKSEAGGVFYKDQDGPKYSPVILGKFSNK